MRTQLLHDQLATSCTGHKPEHWWRWVHKSGRAGPAPRMTIIYLLSVSSMRRKPLHAGRRHMSGSLPAQSRGGTLYNYSERHPLSARVSHIIPPVYPWILARRRCWAIGSRSAPYGKGACAHAAPFPSAPSPRAARSAPPRLRLGCKSTHRRGPHFKFSLQTHLVRKCPFVRRSSRSLFGYPACMLCASCIATVASASHRDFWMNSAKGTTGNMRTFCDGPCARPLLSGRTMRSMSAPSTKMRKLGTCLI